MIELKPAINEVKLTLKSISSPINLGTVVEPVSGGSVPTEVRQAIYTLLENAAYATTGLEDEIAIVQAWAQEVTALSLEPTSLELSNDTPQTIVATVVPSGSTVTWSSSDESVATVVGGVVTGVGNGSCVITASAGNKSANCVVTVSGFATLESISAVYTQSGTVYQTDSLDSLKTDLVVTATYSDTSTATIPSDSYTLSGTLDSATSTITVTYGGKTTTFDVAVTLYTWLYRASDGELLSAQDYVNYTTSGEGGTETLSNNNLVIHTYPHQQQTGTAYLKFAFVEETSQKAFIKCRAKLVNAQIVPSTLSEASGLRFQLSNGTAGAQAYFLDNDGKITIRYNEGTTAMRVDTNFLLSDYHIFELILDGNNQSLVIDGETVFNTSNLSTAYATANTIFNQSSRSAVNPNGITTNIDWLAFKEVE